LEKIAVEAEQADLNQTAILAVRILREFRED